MDQIAERDFAVYHALLTLLIEKGLIRSRYILSTTQHGGVLGRMFSILCFPRWATVAILLGVRFMVKIIPREMLALF